jgi:hypothetical protein
LDALLVKVAVGCAMGALLREGWVDVAVWLADVVRTRIGNVEPLRGSLVASLASWVVAVGVVIVDVELWGV